jgi:SAM-dependent methyltransferase
MNSIDYYNKNSIEYFNGTIKLDLSVAYSRFLKHIPSEGHILDAGCGSGRDSFYFIGKGYEVTAFDASEKMVELSSDLIKQKVLKMRFQDIDFDSNFDGVWACASLLHVNRNEVDAVFQGLIKSLKPNGVFYASFKYGSKELVKDNRYFNCYDKTLMDELLSKHSEVTLIDMWINNDLRNEKKSECWLNLIMKKSHF